MPLLELDRISLAYGQHTVASQLSLSLEAGEIGCLLGPSGCGKTTVLRAIAGFERVNQGEIRLGDNRVSTADHHTPPEQRHIGMVFQDYALFPHLSIGDNIAFGLRGGDKAGRVRDMLGLVGLEEQGHKYPHELSGGQQQRVALARALAPAPRLLLLDEPFSNLDVELRERLSHEVRDILKATGTTAILVTHDQHEAFAVADRIGLMHQGQLQQWDTAYNLYHCPANRFVAGFIGEGVLLPGEVVDHQHIRIALGTLESQTPLTCGPNCAVCRQDCRLDVLLRPDDIIHDDASPLQAQVVHKAFRGADFLYTLALPGGDQILSLVPSHHNHAVGEAIGIRLEIDHVIAFPPTTGPAPGLPAVIHCAACPPGEDCQC